jgi:alpha-glucosidase
VVPDAGDGWQEPEIEHYTTRLRRGRVVVEFERENGVSEPPHPLRVRGPAEG